MAIAAPVLVFAADWKLTGSPFFVPSEKWLTRKHVSAAVRILFICSIAIALRYHISLE
jgi:hypothetical protein